MAKRRSKPEVRFRLRITKGEAIAIGPGKTELLEAIARTGSLTSAAKAIGMSYRRAWLLVDTMNQCFATPSSRRPRGARRQYRVDGVGLSSGVTARGSRGAHGRKARHRCDPRLAAVTHDYASRPACLASHVLNDSAERPCPSLNR
jgi:hypothetical protein